MDSFESQYYQKKSYLREIIQLKEFVDSKSLIINELHVIKTLKYKIWT